MARRYKKGLLMGLLLLLSFSSTSRGELSLEALETQLDYTIRSACHGYMVDAIPDMLSDIRSWLNKNTPFCQTVRTLGENESAYGLLKQQRPSVDYDRKARTEINITGGYNADLHRHNDCNDWMCQHIRDQAYDDGHPISLADYKKVEQHCDANYSCIESWFKRWPRPLPTAQTNSSGMSLDALMGSKPAASKPAGQSTANSGIGLSLDAMMGTQPSPTPPQPQQVAKNSNPSTAGLSLDSALGSPSNNHKAADVSLDNVFAGREQLALEESLRKINRYNRSLSRTCSCSVDKSGCYQLPSESLLDSANQIELERFQACSQWQQLQQNPDNSEQAKNLIQQLAQINKQVKQLDGDMDDEIEAWEEERRRMIAQQKREAQQRSDSAYLAGMASILLQAGAATNGLISAEQAAQNAVNVSRSVESGQSWGAAIGNNIVSSVPNQMAANQAATSTPPSSSSRSSGSSSPPKNTQPTSFAVCKTESSGTKVTAGCIGIRSEGSSQGCSGSTCASSFQELCQKVGASRGVPFEYFASGLGTFSSMGQCIAKCENDYGEANWGEYGRKCLGAVSL